MCKVVIIRLDGDRTNQIPVYVRAKIVNVGFERELLIADFLISSDSNLVDSTKLEGDIVFKTTLRPKSSSTTSFVKVLFPEPIATAKVLDFTSDTATRTQDNKLITP